MGTKRTYKKREIGQILNNNAVLVEPIDGKKWVIKCECGRLFVSQPSYTSGHCNVCGRKIAAIKATRHGESLRKGIGCTRLYRIWLSMRTRCNNKKRHDYKEYGGRGIKVCNEWDNYENFRDWSLMNGYANNLSIDRIDNNSGYSSDNCRWTTQSQQMRNTRKNKFLEFNGERKTLVEWSEITGIKYHTLKNRVNKYGYSDEEALTIPVKHYHNNDLRSV